MSTAGAARRLFVVCEDGSEYIGRFRRFLGESFEFVAAPDFASARALIGAADSIAGPGLLLPSRNGEVFRWCLAHGLRVVQPMTLMSLGLYNEPRGAFLPSILF